jgi:hypothetical protein
MASGFLSLSTGAQSSARDQRHVGNTGRIDEAATRYTRPDGNYVVLNNKTGDVVQVSNQLKADFIPHGGK